MKKLIALLLALVMVLGLVACASKTTDETPKTDDSAAAPADTETTDNTAEPADTETTDTAEETTGEERPYYVRDAKDVTGTLTVYTTIGETEQQALRDVWTKYYPDCKLEFQSDSVGTLATRIRRDETCDADVVIGLHREGYYNPESEDPYLAEAIVLKNRKGQTGTVYLQWLPEFTSFGNRSNMSDEDD